MAMSGLKLASAGDDIKLWDVESSFSLVKQFNPHNHNVSNVCWSHDNSYLSSVSNSGDKLSLTVVKNESISTLDMKFLTGKTFVDFNSTSRYMVSGAEQVINVWDLKVRSLRKTYKGHTGTVTCAKFNWNDTYIASGSNTGEIIVYNAVSGQGCSPMVAPKVQAIKELQYSQFKKSLLGSASDDGAINLWDTNTRRLIHTFSDAHRAPATGINFSPLNAIFLMSVGLDKRIICYDLEGKKCPKVIVAESPLTSIDVMADGATVAVGSTRGKIYIYDLRKGETPVKVINAHKSSVQCLKFQNSIQTDSNSRGNAKVSSTKDISPNNRRQLPQAPADPTHADIHYSVENTDNIPHGVNNGTLDEDAFSPVRDNQDIGPGYREMDHSSHQHSDSNVGSFLRQETHSSSGVFSPLAEGGSFGLRDNIAVSPLFTNQSNSHISWNASSEYNTHGQAMNASRSHQDSYLSSSKYSSPPGMGTSSTNHNGAVATYSQGQEHSKPLANGSSPYLDNVSPRMQSLAHHSQEYRPSASPPHPAPTQTGSKHPSEIRSPHTGISASPSIPVLNLDDSPSGSAGANSSGPGHSFPSPDGVNAVTGVNHSSAQRLQDAPVPSGNFQTQVLRNLIHEELEDFYDKIHKEVLNLQVEMIRQFHIQQNEVNQLLQHHSVNQDLVAEIEKLREENKRLKKHF